MKENCCCADKIKTRNQAAALSQAQSRKLNDTKALAAHTSLPRHPSFSLTPLPIIIMADTAPKTAEKELFEPIKVVDAKAQALAELIKNSKHFIAFTGAGVSTSAGRFNPTTVSIDFLNYFHRYS
jgi:formylmethanofuran dehydrogenase subunit B